MKSNNRHLADLHIVNKIDDVRAEAKENKFEFAKEIGFLRTDLTEKISRMNIDILDRENRRLEMREAINSAVAQALAKKV